MSIAIKSIILEDVLEEIFAYLPVMAYKKGSQTFPVVFGYGDETELNIFLKNKESSDVYPLIWLLYPYDEDHSRTSLEVQNVSFILAMDTDSNMENRERIKETFGKVLMPLFFNLRLAFKRANIISTNHEYKLVKHPNFSESASRKASAGTFIWDALKVTTSFKVIDNCLKEIKF